MSLPRRASAVGLERRLNSPKILTLLGAMAVGIVSGGTCPAPQFVSHMFGSYYEHCADGQPLLSHIFLLSNPAVVNTGAFDATCTAGDTDGDGNPHTAQIIACQPEAGTAGDGRVTVQFDWGGIGTQSMGCPNPTFGPDGSARLHIHTVSEDGRSLLTSVGFHSAIGGYIIEGAHPLDGTLPLPLACDEPGRQILQIDGSTPSGGNLAVNLTVFAPRISTDCDPGSGGELLGTCTSASPIATVTPGRVYLQRGTCAFLPVHDLRTFSWTFLADSDAQGHAAVSFPAPAVDECVYLGATYRFNGQESPAIGGFLKIPHAGCPDADGDGVTTCDQDCDDSNPQAFPGNPEACDGIDNDCDQQVDEDLGVISCGRGRCTRSVPACVGGVPQVCTPPGPPSKKSKSDVCGPAGIGVVPVPAP